MTKYWINQFLKMFLKRSLNLTLKNAFFPGGALLCPPSVLKGLSNRVVYNHCQSCLNSYKLIQCLFIIKKPLFTCENFCFWKFFKCFLFDKISSYCVLGSLKHTRPPCKGPTSVFFRFLISHSQHTVSKLRNLQKCQNSVQNM